MKGPNSNIKSTSLPSFAILKDGKEISDASQVISIRIESEFSKISSAEIILSDGSAAKQDFEISSKDDLIPGSELEIKLGYYQQNTTVFKGEIIKHGIRTSSNENSTLNLELRHKVYKSSLQRKSSSYPEMKDSDIIESILGKYGVDKTVDATSLEHKQMVQFNCTDWDFINTRAEANGMLFITKTDKIEVIKPKASSSEIFELLYGLNVYEADLEIDNRFSFEDYEAEAWNYAEQDMEAGAPDVPSLPGLGDLSASDLSEKSKPGKYVYSNGAAMEQSELNEILNAKKIKSLLGKIRGIVKCEGTSEAEPGDTVKLSGLGSRFNGDAFVSGVMHEYSAGRWITTLQIGVDTKRFIDRYTDVNEIPAGGILPAVSGLQVGKVSEIEDKDGEERILVKIPVVSKDEDTIWARVARLDAGNSRGSVFHPEIDDEVILGFINDDPRQAVILGMMHSSKNPVPDDLKAEGSNAVKGFITRNNLQLLFDDEKKIITVKTEKGSVIIDDDKKEITVIDDSNKNKIILSGDGIAVESGKDLKLTAKGNVTIEGNKVDIKAKTSLNASGNSGASVKSNGATEIKGSLVNIN